MRFERIKAIIIVIILKFINCNMAKITNKQLIFTWIILLSALTITAWQFDTGRLILYPFTILGTWFHEMGHGLMALILGGHFDRLEIFSNGSGLAYWSGPVFGGDFGKGFVAAAGPIGPTLAGALFLFASAKEKWGNIVLWILGILLVTSGIIWVRSLVGIGIVVLFGAITILIALKGKAKLKQFYLIFHGVQACLSVYLSIDYLLMSQATVSGEMQMSDTGVMSMYWFLPHWLWGSLIIFISILTIWKALTYALKHA